MRGFELLWAAASFGRMRGLYLGVQRASELLHRARLHLPRRVRRVWVHAARRVLLRPVRLHLHNELSVLTNEEGDSR